MVRSRQLIRRGPCVAGQAANSRQFEPQGASNVALAAGPISFQRFLVSGKLPTTVTDRLVAALQERSFGRIPPTADRQVGWIGPRHLFENEFDAAAITAGRFAHLAVRVDQLAAPGAVLRSYIRQEEDVTRAASGRDFLSRGERKKAREAALLRAEQESRAGQFRRMGSIGVLFDLERRTIYIANTSTKSGEIVAQLVADTLGVTPEAADPGRIAYELLHASGLARGLENLTAMPLVRAPAGSPEPETWAGRDQPFLGSEWLTWLWFRSDADEGNLQLRGGTSVTVALDRVLQMKCDFGLTGTATLVADGPTQLAEARAALRTGKRPVRAGLVLGSSTGEARLTLSARQMAVSGLVVPDSEERDPLAARVERFEHLADTVVVLDALFEQFLTLRTSRDWRNEHRRMCAWAAESPAEPLLAAASG